MQAVLSACYFLECFAVATVLSRAAPRYGPDPRLCHLLAWSVIFFAVFFGGFHILGYLNLATGLPLVNGSYAAFIGLITVAGLYVWCAWKIPQLLGFNVAGINVRSSIARLSNSHSRCGKTLAIATFLAFAAVTGMLIWGFPRGYEATAYHLPIALHTFQSESLKIWDTTFMHTYPANASLFFGYLLGLVPEHVVTAANLGFLVPLFLAVYALGRTTGADESSSLLAALGLVTIPMVAFSAFVATADLGGIAFLAMALYFATRKSSPHLAYRTLSGLAAGVAFGFKSLHLMAIAILFMLIVLQDWTGSRNTNGLRRFWSTIHPALVFCLSTLVMGSFWLVRNYIELGNPLYPVHLSIFNVFHWTKPPDIPENLYLAQFQWVRSSGEWFLYPWVEWHYAGENFTSSAGLGPFFAATVPAACVVSLIGMIKREEEDWTVLASLLGGGILILLVWAVLNMREPRYAMGALVFLVPLAARMVSVTERRSRRALEVIIAVCVLSMLFVIFSKQLVEFGSNFFYADHERRHASYGYPELVDRLPPGSRVVNFARRTLNYGLYGASHQNRVISFREAFRSFGIQTRGFIPEEAPEAARLKYGALKQLGATHFVTEGNPTLVLDDCVSLEEIERMDRDPGLGKPLPRALTVYRIKYCDRASAGN